VGTSIDQKTLYIQVLAKLFPTVGQTLPIHSALFSSVLSEAGGTTEWRSFQPQRDTAVGKDLPNF